MMPHGWPWPYHYAIPIRMSRAELRWLAWLWLAWAYTEQRAEQFYRNLWASYDTPSHRRLEAFSMRESPFLKAVRRAG